MGFADYDEVSIALLLAGLQFDCFGEVVSENPLVCSRNVLMDGNQDGLVDPDDPADTWTPSGYEAPNGIQFGFLRAFKKHLRIGVALTFPTRRLILFEQQDAYLPVYVRWKNRPQRLGIHVAAAVRIVDGINIGVGVSILAQARIDLDFTVTAIVSDDQITGDDEELSAVLLVNPEAVRADIRPAFAPIVGLAFDLGVIHKTLHGVRLGVVYRHPITIDVDPAVLSLDFNVQIEDIGTLGEILIPIQAQIVYRAIDFASPRQIAIGFGWDRPRFALGLDITWNQWSKVLPSVARIDEERTDIEIGLIAINTQVLNARVLDELVFEDTWDVRVGGELRPPPVPLMGTVGGRFEELAFVVRLGYAFEPPFVPLQTGRTNFLDNPTHTIAAGFGVSTKDPFKLMRGGISLDGFFQLKLLQRRDHVKDPSIAAETIPEGWPLAGAVHSGGRVIAGGVALSFSI
jgi:hypothetical protein